MTVFSIFFVIIGFSNENCCTLHKSEDKFLTTLRIVHKTRLTLANVTKIDDYDQFGFLWWNFWIILPSVFPIQFHFFLYVCNFFLLVYNIYILIRVIPIVEFQTAKGKNRFLYVPVSNWNCSKIWFLKKIYYWYLNFKSLQNYTTASF